MKLLRLLVWLLLLCQPIAGVVGAEPSATITYIGSSGYLVKTTGHKLLLDGAFDNDVARFEVTTASEPIKQQLIHAQPPFDKLDMILVSHAHKGHFEATSIAQVIINNPQALVVTTEAVYSQLAELGELQSSSLNQIHYPRSEMGQRTHISHQGLIVAMTKTAHWGGLEQLNVEVTADDVNLAYALEAASFTPENVIDIQFVTALAPQSNARFRILTHQSGNEKKAELKKQVDLMPSTYFFTASGESIAIETTGNTINIK
ncbi:MBL fold metallo-hydrolase [Neiella marina]|uniref:MBL fold metallo-hydrolase n=1 Tax=Neiella holothuriorum TaxID=2870530 RepID=A0ABS7EEA2_9GAMM|nr:MBL fold metallo-hydrolase [Neiella holothuriorum]MBW8190668.1 MBL fold metallo-hydrolase [Neiella holothuriorum]